MREREIVLCVSGGIAAYKAAALASRLTREGANVHTVMTKNACEFISPLTFESLTHFPVVTELFDRSAPWEITHVALAKKAELVIVAPATANIIGKAANGIADDFMSTFLMAARCPVLYAPAMNDAMYENSQFQRNLETLKKAGANILEAKTGRLACSDEGRGRMREPEEIVCWTQAFFENEKDLRGLHILVTAGPTRERIDDVRFLSNRSSGKMGYAIAQEAARRGAKVTLVSGPVALATPKGVERIDVESAAQMCAQVLDRFSQTDIVIKAAAVADYTPERKIDGKLKKGEELTLRLLRTQDILKTLGEAKREGQVLIGFAAEMGDKKENAKEKLKAKNLDMICFNDVSKPQIGFGSDENDLTLFFREGEKQIDRCSKAQAANAILDEAAKLSYRK